MTLAGLLGLYDADFREKVRRGNGPEICLPMAGDTKRRDVIQCVGIRFLGDRIGDELPDRNDMVDIWIPAEIGGVLATVDTGVTITVESGGSDCGPSGPICFISAALPVRMAFSPKRL